MSLTVPEDTLIAVPDVDVPDLRPSERAMEIRQDLVEFMRELGFPSELLYEEQRPKAGSGDSSAQQMVEDLKCEARRRGLWNVLLPAGCWIGQLDDAGIGEVTGWSLQACTRGHKLRGARDGEHGTVVSVRD